jgi:hypothetical protein
VQHHRVRHSRRIPYLIPASPIRLIRVFTCKRIGLSLVLSLVFIAAFLNISARIDYSLDLQILNNTHRPDGNSPIFSTFGASFKLRQVARKMISQFLLIFPLSCATGTLLTTALPTVRLPAHTSSSKKSVFCCSFFFLSVQFPASSNASRVETTFWMPSLYREPRGVACGEVEVEVTQRRHLQRYPCCNRHTPSLEISHQPSIIATKSSSPFCHEFSISSNFARRKL